MEKSKLEKYREERARHLEKIADLQKRVRALDQRIMENESMEIRALMRSENVTLEELTALVRRMQQQHRQPVENTGLSFCKIRSVRPKRAADDPFGFQGYCHSFYRPFRHACRPPAPHRRAHPASHACRMCVQAPP